MHLRVCLIGLLLLLVTASLSLILPQRFQPPCVLSADDYQVFSSVLDGLGRPEDPDGAWKGKEIVIPDVTTQPRLAESKWGPWGFPSNSKAAPAKETEAAFKSRANDICLVEAKLHTAIPYKLVEHDELKEMFKKGGWGEFYRKYPKAAGFWDFSHPGYNKVRNEAVVYVGYHCRGLCGTGHLFFLAKEDGQWKVKNRLMLWIS